MKLKSRHYRLAALGCLAAFVYSMVREMGAQPCIGWGLACFILFCTQDAACE